MKNISAILSSIVIISLFAGCSANSVKNDFNFTNDKDTGLVILSVTHNEKPGTSNAAALFYMNKKGHENDYEVYKSKLEKMGGLLGPGVMSKPSDFEGVYGVLYAVELEAGTYELTRWLISTYNGTLFYPTEAPPTLEFTINPHEITYIGNLHMHMSTGENIFGMVLPSGGLPEIIDQTERDLSLFKQRYPQLSDKDINANILTQGPWLTSASVNRNLPMQPVIVK